MFKLGFQPSVVTCVKADVELVDHMENMRYRSDVKTYDEVLINGLCKLGGNF